MSYPISITQQDARRIRQGARTLIRAQRLRPGVYDLHDQHTTRKNQRRQHDGRPDLQTDPTVATIEIRQVTRLTIADINQKLAIAAGHKTTHDFREDWIRRHRSLNLTDVVHAHEFVVVDARYLAASGGDYTTDPRQAIREEASQAVGAYDLERYARQAHERDAQRKLDRLADDDTQPLSARIAALEAAHDRGEIDASRQLAAIRRRIQALEAKRRAA